METKACRHFLEGRCRHGDDCRYSHAEKPPPAPPAPPAPTAPAFPKPDWGDPESAAAAFALQEMNDSKKRIEKDEWNDYWALGDNFLLSPDGNFVVTWGHVEEGRLSDSPVHKIIQARFVHQLAPPVVKIIKSLHFIQSSDTRCRDKGHRGASEIRWDPAQPATLRWTDSSYQTWEDEKHQIQRRQVSTDCALDPRIWRIGGANVASAGWELFNCPTSSVISWLGRIIH
ncbi:unnamed protein product [Durusdinium trenchii]|uniref:C3H1-type domain-containing protein n=1 Tax=Durusdinium trenchii TaxID=1381693 RepID=A0ABP0QHZ8_9DINO